ncbi:Sm-like ribonucleo protein [Amniculicola lignicola CBS 123094]|uniref:Sm-like ribonucleo protein n=1 Tax=Amniculicola lignicola CBS 123094 TaxID=1392246 RepID=A0A6A5WAH3_9PLEO|nr:Sm-like ribonucleo protein [Amniculicola lignicola CBS 123094]
MDKRLTVKFSGGREIAGVLKGYDQLTNLVLDDCKEFMIAEDNTHYVRTLGLLVARGTLLVSIAPVDGSEQIENPFLAGGASSDSE